MQDTWKKALTELKRELPADFYEPFIEPLVPLKEVHTGDSGDILILGVRDRELLPHLKSKYREPIQTKLKSLMGREIHVEFEIFGNHREKEEEPNMQSIKAPSPGENLPSWLHPHYTFDRFFKSHSNEMAFLAAKNVTLHKGVTNPLYIYSESGLGKTHLTHAIVHELIRKKRGIKVGYFTINDFQDEFLTALKQKDTLSFKNRYRKSDILIVEDIHFLKSTAVATQEEFYYIFNHYYEKGNQVILTSDRPVMELHFPGRLMSRFLSGLQVKIDPPDRDLRRNFLQQKAQEIGLEMGEELLQFLVDGLTDNIRELESAINKLYFLNLQGSDFNDLSLTASHFQDLMPPGMQGNLDVEQIVRVVCRHYNISKEEILSSSRKAEYTLPRHIAMYLAINHSNLNKSAVARYFRRSDHTTVINAEKKIKRLMEKDRSFEHHLDRIVNDIRKECG